MFTRTEIRFIKLLKTGYRSSMNELFSQYSIQGITSLFTILLLWIGSYYVISNELSAGELLSFYAILGYFTGPVTTLITSNKIIQNALIAADRLFEILDLDVISEDQSHHLMETVIHSIRFSDVYYRYDFRPNVFKGLNASFKKGQITAIVGESGSGKSTLIHLIQRLYPLTKGKILINEQDIKYLKRSELNKLISVVPQSIHLFEGNLIDNIAVGHQDIQMDKIISICKSLDFLPFIEKLPQGFYTRMGENGTSLSGGQKQKVAIARALYQEPEVLLLDEATSSLDSFSDAALRQTIITLKKKDKTIVLVSHRLQNLNIADKILVLKEGRLVQEGAHEELIRTKGVYQDLWKQQVPSLTI
jgi:ATP-binding cassette subfamily B protein